jgi:hypothetical protein
MESPNSQRPKKKKKKKQSKAGEEKSHEHANHFLEHQGDCSQKIHPGRPKRQICLLLSRFTTAT